MMKKGLNSLDSQSRRKFMMNAAKSALGVSMVPMLGNDTVTVLQVEEGRALYISLYERRDDSSRYLLIPAWSGYAGQNRHCKNTGGRDRTF